MQTDNIYLELELTVNRNMYSYLFILLTDNFVFGRAFFGELIDLENALFFGKWCIKKLTHLTL